MGLHGGKWVWTLSGATYSEEVNDTTPSKVAAANARANTALSGTGKLKDIHNRDSSPTISGTADSTIDCLTDVAING